MTRRRWIADEFTSVSAALTGAHAAHLARTLRARVGQEFEVTCGDQVRCATVTSVADERVEFALGEPVSAPESVPITLLLAVFKFDRMEWAIEKCTELNVTTIVPIIARRTEKHLAQAAEKRLERWQRIAREASEQARRATPPAIANPVKLRDAMSAIQSNFSSVIPTDGFSRSGDPALSLPKGTCFEARAGLRIVLAENEREVTLADALNADGVSSLALAIGPEGGWTDDELKLFADANWIAASLGETILRAETAAIAALAIARSAL
jgi:16S rRNA (uracil1498-N3)-methyltransferase